MSSHRHRRRHRHHHHHHDHVTPGHIPRCLSQLFPRVRHCCAQVEGRERRGTWTLHAACVLDVLQSHLPGYCIQSESENIGALRHKRITSVMNMPM